MKELIIISSSTWKFAATFPVALYALGMSCTETLIYTNTGGILGTFISVYLSGFLMKIWDQYWPERLKINRLKKKIFTRKKRMFIKIKTKYGFFGIVILSPVILSIPLGSFLTVKYYGIKKSNILWLIAGQIFWSFVYTFFYIQIKTVLT